MLGCFDRLAEIFSYTEVQFLLIVLPACENQFNPPAENVNEISEFIYRVLFTFEQIDWL